MFHGLVNNDTDNSTTELQLPPPAGPRIKLSEKVFAPVKEYPKVQKYVYTRAVACRTVTGKDRKQWMVVFEIELHFISRAQLLIFGSSG